VNESGVIPSQHRHHHGSPRSHITWGMKNRPVGGSCSETQSHPTMVNQVAYNIHIISFWNVGMHYVVVWLLVILFRTVMIL
jgi:hypothetical protein